MIAGSELSIIRVVANRKKHSPVSPFVINANLVLANAEPGNGIFYLDITPVILSYNLNLLVYDCKLSK